MAGKNHVAIKSKWHIGPRLNSELQFWLYECITQTVLGDTAGLGRELGLLLPVLIMLHVLTWRTLICQASWCIYSSQAHVCFRGPITYQQWFSAKAAGYWAVFLNIYIFFCEHNHKFEHSHLCSWQPGQCNSSSVYLKREGTRNFLLTTMQQESESTS